MRTSSWDAPYRYRRVINVHFLTITETETGRKNVQKTKKRECIKPIGIRASLFIFKIKLVFFFLENNFSIGAYEIRREIARSDLIDCALTGTLVYGEEIFGIPSSMP